MAETNGTSTIAATLQEATTQLEEKDLQLRGMRDEFDRVSNNLELVTESLAELELALEDTGWQRLSGFGDREFSLAGLRKLRRLARLNYLKNPLIRHAVDVQAHYVWGQGMTVSASDEEVNEVIQAFLEDPKNLATFSGHQARFNLEADLRVEGDLYLAFFTNQDTGRVIVRRFVPDEVIEIITNPDDYQEPWFYKRTWTRREFNVETGDQGTRDRVTYHSDWRLIYNRDPDVPHRVLPPDLLRRPDLPGLRADPGADRGRGGQGAVHEAADPGRAGAVPHLWPDAVRHRLRPRGLPRPGLHGRLPAPHGIAHEQAVR